MCPTPVSLSLFAIRLTGRVAEATFTDGRRVRLPYTARVVEVLLSQLTADRTEPRVTIPGWLYFLAPNDYGRVVNELADLCACETAVAT